MAAAWLQRRWPSLLLAIGIGATGLGVMRHLSSQRRASEPAPPPAPITTVTALGRLEPIGEVRTIAPPSGLGGQPTLLDLRVEEGDRVERGQILAVLDSYPRLQAAVADAEARLRLSETRLEIARADHRNNVKSQEAQVRSLRAQLRTAEADYRRNQHLFSEGALSETDRDARQLSRDTAAAALQEAEAELTRQRATTSDSSGQAGTGVSLDVAAAIEAMAEAQATLEQARAARDEALVRAPVAGRVLSVLSRAGETPGDNGIVQIGDTDRMHVVAEVYESDRPRVRPGQPVRITSPALSEPLHGRVATIGAIVKRQSVINTDPSSNTDSRVIEVKAPLDPDSNRRAAGLTNLQVRAVIGP
jgi:HlyD family secretion protein